MRGFHEPKHLGRLSLSLTRYASNATPSGIRKRDADEAVSRGGKADGGDGGCYSNPLSIFLWSRLGLDRGQLGENKVSIEVWVRCPRVMELYSLTATASPREVCNVGKSDITMLYHISCASCMFDISMRIYTHVSHRHSRVASSISSSLSIRRAKSCPVLFSLHARCFFTPS